MSLGVPRAGAAPPAPGGRVVEAPAAERGGAAARVVEGGERRHPRAERRVPAKRGTRRRGEGG